MTYYYKFLFGLLFISIFKTLKCNSQRPHIIFILADDLGWNDVGFHGSAQIPTPNLDSLAFSGIILNRYYVTPICTPSRSALMTGKYPIHTGMQHTVLFGAEPRGLPLHEKILPQYLRDLGYSNHIVGKWHLGHYKRVYTPLFRGFDSHTGFWTGHQDYFDHTAVENPSWGLDMRRGLNVAYDLHGKYTTNVIKEESVNVIKAHNSSVPLFLYVAHAAVHSANPYNPLPAPDDVVEKLSYIENYNRRKFAAMLSVMDDSVGAIVDALEKQNMLENSIIIFSTDNGGPAEGFNLNAASNWPLRGVKNTLWEGGVRGAGLIWSPLIKNRERVSGQMMHISDWLPTLYEAAGGNLKDLPKDIDGLSIWSELNYDNSSKRVEILHNIDDIYGSSSVTVGDWKLHKGTNYNGQWDSWYGPEGLTNTEDYDIDALEKSLAGLSLSKIGQLPPASKVLELRENATVKCANISSSCLPLEAPCLFNIAKDPCEQNNLADHYPEILKLMLDKLSKYNETAIPPSNKPMDPRADPKFWDYTWTNFGDYSQFIIIT